MADYECIRLEKKDHVGHLILCRPEKRNRMSLKFFEEMLAVFPRIDEDDDIRTVLISAEGKSFCAGLDLAEHEHRTPEANIYHSRNWHRVMDLIEFGGLPVVSAMQGAVIGGGCQTRDFTTYRYPLPGCEG